MFTSLRLPQPVIDQPSRLVLRLGLGGGLALAAAYGLAFAVPHVSLLMALLLLSKPGPALALGKGVVLAGVLMLLIGSGVLLVPLLENYAVAALLLIGLGLFAIFFIGTRQSHPLLSLLLVSFTLIPVAGVQGQALALQVVHALAGGVILGAVSGTLMHLLLPDLRQLPKAAPHKPGVEDAVWLAVRGVLIVLPVLLLALQNPALYMAAIMKTATLGQQAGSLNARDAGRELLGSTLLGAGLALLAWLGLSLWPSLWMYTLWITLALCWLGLRLYRILPTRHPPSFWLNAMITLVIFLGPAVQDSASGKDVLTAAVIRLALFTGVALYAWAAIYVLERVRLRFHPAGPRNGVSTC
ncbi:DUF2955 domain-containing protein [Silvimonas iriomotensis]|uniref:DUF2955 domain-containing protein n=1 Tax=Silvimonas iriomotensis TaxID=449662 RepID=A0ABQ2PB22_9NEIS|nr:DUF2955 domain-containing protein [Silvimonas iriomotensis]GGP22321.1 hypothetical protein GCM10010970_24650 [Silvimonas iriomotensis]